MLEFSPVHGAIWVKQLAEKLETEGYSVEGILAEAGIEPRRLNAEEPRLPYEKIALFFELAAGLVGDDCLGFRFGQSRDVRDAGLVGYVGLSSPTMLDAIRNLERYGRVFSDVLDLRAADLEGQGSLIWQFSGSPKLHQRQFSEFSLANLVHSFRVMTGRQLVPLQISFRHPRNASTKDFDTFFGCNVGFASADTTIRFKLADLRLPLRTADNRLLEVLQKNCREVLDRRESSPPSLVTCVERLIVDRLTSGEAKIENIATAVGLSRRTLSRRLAEMGTNFNAITDDLRRELSLIYLRDSQFSMTEIAYFLGYTEVASFSTAFKRWTGATPGQVRKSPTELLIGSASFRGQSQLVARPS